MASASDISSLNQRAREILRLVVDAYVDTGEPVGSRTLSRRLGLELSPATIRNVMADLQEAGLLYAPHASAGRLPTDAGLRLFVDGLLEVGHLTDDERANIDGECAASGKTLNQALDDAIKTLSGLSHCAGLVAAPKTESRLKHIEFVPLGHGRALVVLVTEDGEVENRLIDLPLGLPAASLIQASNFLSTRLVGRTLEEASAEVLKEVTDQRAELDALTSHVVEAGLATWAGPDPGGFLIVRGQAELLKDVTAIEELERIRSLFEALETKEALARLIDAAQTADGVQIFIGGESELFDMTGCSAVISPIAGGQEKVIGAIGVIGPTRINYARIVPMVDYTAQAIGRMLT